jgi:magnesium transporter
MANRTNLTPLIKKFFEHDPVQAAHSLELLGVKEAVGVLKSLPASMASQIFPLLSIEHASNLVKDVPPETFKAIVEKIAPQQGAAIFVTLPADIRDSFINHLSEKTKRRIQDLLTYPENSAGRIMTTDVIAFHSDIRGRDAIQKIRQLAKSKAPSSYFYVIDNENRLVGILNMRDLLLSSGEATLESIMRKEVYAVDVMTDREEVAIELSKRRYFAVPVVDNQQKLLGTVKAEQLLAHVQEEASEDILKMFGAGGDERTFSTIGFSIRKRLGWLCINLGTAFFASSVVALFQNTISSITILAVFMPIVAGQGGNAGAQSLAVVMRGLVLREIPPEKVMKLVIKETTTGTINGILIGIITAAGAYLWHGNMMLGVVIGLAMIINMFAAGLSGATIPLIMKALGFDPAQSSSIILTTVTDCVGFSSFLGLATLFRHYLI